MGRLNRVAVVAAIGLTAGCSGADDPPAPQVTFTATPSGASSPAATPTSTAPMPRPSVPAAARDNTARGAIAMVDHYHRAVEYAYRTGDLKPLAVADPGCEWCREIGQEIRARVRANTYSLGPVYTAQPVRAVRIDARNYLVHIWHRTAPPGSRERVGTTVQPIRAGARHRATWVLEYGGGRWRMISLGQGWCSVAQVEAGKVCAL